MSEISAEKRPPKRRVIFALRRPLYFLASILWLELIYRIFYVRPFIGRGMLFIPLFSLAAALLITLFCDLFRTEKASFIAGTVALGVVWLYFCVQAVYGTVFRTLLVTESLQMAGMVMGSFLKDTVIGILKSLHVIALNTIPLIGIFILRKRGKSLFAARKDARRPATAAIAAIIVIGLCELSTLIPTGGVTTTREMYRQSFDPTITAERFGLVTTLRLDVTQLFFGLEDIPEKPVDMDDEDLLADSVAAGSEGGIAMMRTEAASEEPGEQDPQAEPEPEPVVYVPNVMDIDYEAIAADTKDQNLKNLCEYIIGREPTYTNEYTGMFAGKNLIFMTGEAFWIGCIDEVHTPTLWKLSHEGFVFENFYNPLGTHSTCDGEFALCTGLVPQNGYCAFYQTIGDSMYFCMGNALNPFGYDSAAYHDHYASYYRRDETHPNMGYVFKGVGKSGVDIAQTWPESDLEMMEFTLPLHAQAGQERPFNLYYMTVSGHMNYNFAGNYMSAKHKDDVADLDMSEEARAYIACNMELDLALKYTLDYLEEIGELENTVICLGGDHYPYGMNEQTWYELRGGVIDTTFEICHSTLILWCGGMDEPVVIDKPCCSVDVLPTLLNLFGVEYDSRLLAGRDILSDCEGIAVFNNRNFVSAYGTYDARRDVFTAFEGVEVPEGYVKETYAYVKGVSEFSDKILKNDLYRKLGLVR